MPVLRCPHCLTSVDVHPDDIGFKLLCPSCRNAFQAGEAESPASEPMSPPPIPSVDPLPKNSEGTICRCTACREKVRIEPGDLGHWMECPLCGEKFRAESENSLPPSDERPSQRRSRSDADDEDDDDLDYRRPRRRRYREDDKSYILEKAREAILWPANGLLWTGIIVSLLCVILTAGLVFAGMMMMDQPDPYKEQPYVIMFIYAFLAGMGIPYHIVLAVAGYRMKQLRGTGWAYAGAGLAIATIAISGPCIPSTWACLTFGIWTFVAYGKREVKDAIRINNGLEL